MKCLPIVQSLPSEKQLMRYSFIFIVVLLLSLWKVQGQSIKHQIGLGNSVTKFQNWFDVKVYFSPSLYYIRQLKNSKLKLGIDFQIVQGSIGRDNRIKAKKTGLMYVHTRMTFSLDVPLYYNFAMREQCIMLGIGPTYRFRVDHKAAGLYFDVSIRDYFHDIGFSIPLVYQKKLSKRFSLQLQGVFRQYNHEPNSLSFGLGILYNGYRKQG
jgi:hypothetical protein